MELNKPVSVNSYSSFESMPKKSLYRLYNEPASDYLLRIKFSYDPASGKNKAILPDINKAFTEFVDSGPSKRQFIQVCGNLVLTSSMLWDIMQHDVYQKYCLDKQFML
jgi:hypothetical protein